MRFEPIAIVGQGAVLPDARDPDAFWDNIAHGRNSITKTPENRWRAGEQPWTPAGGYVQDEGTGERQVRWVLEGVRQALAGTSGRTGLIMGNLSFPTEGMAEYANQVWRGSPTTDPRNRFMSGLPAHLAAKEFGLEAGAFSLDAACASSLYAIKLACDKLHAGEADVMVAGAVNCADDLFIHAGFTALQALSKSGQSRPFHQAADGLVPAEGAAFVSLMRLRDVKDHEVLGVIRGVGLSNDGRGAGLLVPSAEGQERAMRLAYEMAGIDPATVELLECHATGTPVGDAVEVTSAARVFTGHKGLAIGSAKSNVGHLITAAGVAGLLKVIGGMKAGLKPATLHATDTIDALRGTPLRVLTEAEEWSNPQRAAVSAFGFGGNNAHLVVDAPNTTAGTAEPLPRKEPVAIVAIGGRVGTGDSAHDLRRDLFTGTRNSKRDDFDVVVQGLRVPPNDLKQMLPQQLLVLEAAREAVQGLDLPRDRTMVLIGMGCDAEVARYGARWRAQPDERDAITPELTSTGVVGTMPNIIANRLNAHLDLAGPSFTVSAEEASGVVALELAARAIRNGEADAAVVGAVDLSHEPVHEQALKELGVERKSGDAAVVLVLRRQQDADEVIALLDDATTEADLTVGDRGFDPAENFGSPHAAKGLLAVATAALALHHRALPRPNGPADPAFDMNTAKVVVKPLEAPEKRVRLRKAATRPWIAERPPRLHMYSGADRAEVLRALDAGRESNDGPARLVLLDNENSDAARAWLTHRAPKPEGAAFRESPINGEIGFVFTGGMAAYPGMGRELLLAFPHLIEEIEARSGSVRDVVGWAFDGPDSEPGAVLDQIWGTALLSQVHAAITRDVLGIKPNAALGYSAGESNALVALGVWTDMRKLRSEMTDSGMFSRQVAGEFAAIRKSWARQGIAGTRWKNYLVGVDPDHARKVLHTEPAAHLIAVNSPSSCIIGGDVGACERVMSVLDTTYTMPIPYELAVHTPELGEVRNEWWRLHCRPTTPPPGVRFYSCATDDSYFPTAERVADALTAQAVGTMDFAGAIDKAWSDGVRVFVEHGPKALCADWIRQTLGGREHLAISLDAQDGRSVRQLSRVAAELLAAGIPVNVEALHDHLTTAWPAAEERGRVLTLPAHPPEVRLSPTTTTMVRPPVLPPVLTSVQRPSHPDEAAAPGPVLAGNGKPGPKFDRAQLEHLAGGRISELFGPLFAKQDDYVRQCRMPQPPMLLADRVTGIDAEPGSMGTGTIWTETDVLPDSWYLDSTGRMPPGIVIESGQADLLLISWLGADLLNEGERVYRLLGCELTYHGSPPLPGETLRYEINIDGHAELNGIRLFFFHYDCYSGDELKLSVRKGQAGFFTDAELAATTGVIWDPPEHAPATAKFTEDQVRAFADGRPWDCFGPDWDLTRAHSRTPRIDNGRMLFLDEVTAFGEDYLRAETKIQPTDWFFDGHFKNDPCMPGTLMFQGCLQAMSFYMAGRGLTIGNDSWRFEPVPGESYEMRCRGQVTPDSRELTYEVFVSELVEGPIPTLYADVLCTVDGVKAFHAKRVGLRLVPDWPLDQWRGELLAGHNDDGVTIAEVDGVRFDYEALLACAWGRPSKAFGKLYERFDSHRRVARLPGAPYHFMSRITAVTGVLGGMESGSTCVAEYDVPDDVWYFAQNGQVTMPLSVLMEVVLQPCGWLASYVGCAVEIDQDLLFRNLDGTCTIHGEITPETQVLRTEVKLRDISINGTMIIVPFDVKCFADDELVLELDTVFGFFPPEAFVDQAGLAATEEERAALAPSSPVVDLAKYCSGELRLPGSMLLMLDRVTGYDPTGGKAGLGRLTAEKDVDAGEWFFKAHFFQDPVQPGSLGIEALYQLLQFYLLERGAGEGIANPRFEMMMDAKPLVWKYRGQVVPTHKVISSELEITEFDGRSARAKAWLWVDGKRIYSAVDIGVRVVSGETDDGWLADHRPTWTVPVLPMMSVLDQLAGDGATALRDVELRRWIPADKPLRLKTETDGDEVTLLAWREARMAALSRYEVVATATVGTPGVRPAPFPGLTNAEPVTDFYTSGALFHGPAFQYLKELRRGQGGASGVLDAAAGSVPRGNLHQGLLDAATHVIPHDSMWLWYREIPRDKVAYPHRITSFEQYEPLPHTGDVQVEARFAGFENGDRRFPVVHLQLLRDGQVLVALRLVEVLMPTGTFGAADSAQRRAFLRDREYAGGLGLSTTEDGVTTLTLEAVAQCDWLAGTVAQAYALPPGSRGGNHLAHIAVADHVARQERVHPSAVEVSGTTAVVNGRTYQVQVDEQSDTVVVRG